MRISNLFFVSIALLALSGCATIQQQLQPLVCECEMADTCAPAPRDMEIATAIALHQVGTAHHRAHGEFAYRAPEGELNEAIADADGVDEAVEEATLAAPQVEPAAQASQRATSEPRRSRAATRGTGDAVDAVNQDLSIPLTTDRERETFAAAYGIQPPAGALAFQGVFDRSGQSSVAIVEPGVRVRFYRDGALIAQHQFEDRAPLEISEELAAIIAHPSSALDLLNGPLHHLQMVHAIPGEEDTMTYYLGLHKVIGQFVGTSFYQPIARRDASGEVQPLAAIRYLQGDEHRTIEWIHLDESGQPVGEPVLYEWNRWEGVFRVPGLPPTAPTREAPRS